MDGRGSWRDNVVIERFWRRIKYEDVYLRAYTKVLEARAAIGRYMHFFNTVRPHSSVEGRTPDAACFTLLPSMVMAA